MAGTIRANGAPGRGRLPAAESPLQLRRIVYVSTATTRLGQDALEHLLAQSRAYNAGHQITGVLLYRDGNFAQAIEGPGGATAELLGALRRDARHRDMMIILDATDHRREFGGWAMAFRHVRPGGAAAAALAELLLDSPALADHIAEGDGAKRLIRRFLACLR